MCLLSVYGFCAVHYALGDFFGVNGLSAVDILGGKRDFMWLHLGIAFISPLTVALFVARTTRFG